MAYTHLNPGKELEVSEHAYFHYEDNAEVAEFVTLSLEELKQRETDSITEEKAIYSKLCEIIAQWHQQASHTLNLKKAQEYLHVLPTWHTSNQWKEGAYNWYEISNMVYKMTYRIEERADYRSPKKPPPIYWELTWDIYFNTPKNPDYSGSGRKIAGQRDKKFRVKADMEKYLDGRIKAYAHLFTEISPPIPKEHEKRFCINGVLLPGYTVESPELLEPDKEQVDDLLSLLLDEDIGGEAPELPPDPQPEEKTPEAVWSRNRQQRQRSGRTPQAPAR